MHFLLAGLLSPIFDPIVAGISATLAWLTSALHTVGVSPGVSLGLSLMILAAMIRLIFWKLNVAQFKAMIAMQKVAPKLKKLQERYKSEPQKLQQEQMALYKEQGVNPLAGCWPTLVQLPILFSVYYAVISHRELYAHAAFLWIGSPLAAEFPKILAQNLAGADILLVVVYMVTQYISMRFTTMPATDPAQAQQLKVMQILSPLMIGFFGYRANWPSAMVLYWLSYNVFTMAQQFYMLRKYHEPLSFIDSEHVITEDLPASPAAAPALSSGNPAKKSKKKTTKGA
ncbi:MAG: YidC/Oxa1 family membrane protein insertase [Vulcanimicrobiaceae bacterium]